MWHPWFEIGLPTRMHGGTTVTAFWREPGEHLDLFATGPDGAVWSVWWNNVVGWRPEGWLLLHPERKMRPGAAVTAAWREAGKHLDLFATDAAGIVWSIWWNNSEGWRPEGWLAIYPERKMEPGATIAAIWRDAGKHLDLFATDTDGAVWSVWWNDTQGWRPDGWLLIRPETRMRPGAVVAAVWRQPGNHLDLFSTDIQGVVWSIWWNDIEGWRPEGWLSIGPETRMAPGTEVTALWRQPGKHLDLFATGTDGTVWSTWWNDVQGWRPEGWLLVREDTKMRPGSPVTACWREPGKHLDLFTTDAQGTVWSIWWNDVIGWRVEGWLSLFPVRKMHPGASVTAIWREPGKHLDVFATARDGTVWSAWWNEEASREWGLLANPGFENQQMKAAFFFAGSSRGPEHEKTYTVRPLDAGHRAWGANLANRELPLREMAAAGVNVVLMSHWGELESDRWKFWAPMLTSPEAHAELFDAAVLTDRLVLPVIEGGAATYPLGGSSAEFRLRSELGADTKEPAPYLVYRIQDLIRRYLKEPTSPAWPGRWAQLKDRDGNPRYAIMLMHVASDRLAPHEHERFAGLFDHITGIVRQRTGVSVGFTLDLIPADHDDWRYYFAGAHTTGPYLKNAVSVLGVQAFIPEITRGKPRRSNPNPRQDEIDLITYKESYLREWIEAGVPVFFDATPGYYATIFNDPDPVRYGNNDAWRADLLALRRRLAVRGVSYHCWNGYTEGYAGMPIDLGGDANYRWLKVL